jgi:hypothetical protein
VSEYICHFSVENALDFLRGLNAVQLESQNDQRFLDVFRKATATCAETKYYILWAPARSTTFNVLLRYGEELANDLALWLKETIALFMSTEFPYENSSPEAIAWNQAIVVSVNALNAMAKPLFDACFNAACHGLLDMIKATSLEVRKQLNTAMQRRLI